MPVPAGGRTVRRCEWQWIHSSDCFDDLPWATTASSSRCSPTIGRAFPALDSKTGALVRLGALISLGASTTSYRLAVEVAYAAGATDEEIVGVLAAVAPAAGTARAVAAAPGLALALGYDVEDDLT